MSNPNELITADENERRVRELFRRNQALQLALADSCSQLEEATRRLSEAEERWALEISEARLQARLVAEERHRTRHRRKLRKLLRNPLEFFRDVRLFRRRGGTR